MNFTRPIRGWIIFAQVFGTIFSVAGLIVVCAMYDQIQNSIGYEGNPEGNVIIDLIIAILCYVIVKQVINMVVIIHACNTMDDFTLSANRWIISSLSLTVGGFFTPFIMASFPNVNIRSTINPKVWLSKVYGYTLLIGGLIFIVVFAAMAGKDFGYNQTTKSLAIAFFVINGVFVIFGATLMGLFVGKKANDTFDAESSLGGFMRFTAGIVAVVVTLELVIMLVYNFVEIISSCWDAFSQSSNQNGSVNPFMIILAIFNLIIGLVYLGFLTQVTVETMRGLWSGEADYTVFEPLADRQGQRNISAN